ncbi:MAG: PDZ domain-containing protein [Alphaproteobacteria bacterium]|nr:PDZ domain-containing protein [Alphaproteobacteria bacterium]
MRPIVFVLLFGAIGVFAPQRAAAQTAPPASSSYAGKRLAIRVAQDCPSDPDPLGIVSDNLYSDCDQDELDQLRGWLAAEITAKNIFAGVVDTDADLTLTVTLTKDQEIGSDTIFGDLANEDQYEAQADYRLTEAAGTVLLSGSVDSRAKDYADSDIEGVHKDLMAKVAEAVVTGAPAGISPAAPPKLSPWQQQAQAAGDAGYFDLIASAYRALPTKPPLPDEARTYKLQAEAAVKSGDIKAGALAYLAALRIALWWPEGHREYALLAAKLNRPAVAASEMQDYLRLAPDAPDAAQARAEIEEWSRLAPPLPPPPASLPMSPEGSSRLGILIADTPGIVASAMGKPDLEGALVTVVMTGSPAESGGVAKGDVVVGYDGKPVAGAMDLAADIKDGTPGAKISLEVLRGQKQLTLAVQF